MLETRDFADPDDCRTVIDAYERCVALSGTAIGDAFWDYRVLYINSFSDAENATRRILQDWRNRATAIASNLDGRQLYPDTIQIVRWTGQEMPPHQDDRHPDGSPHGTPWREWAGVVYLNDDYTGGRLYFPETDEHYSPVAGSLVLFPGPAWHGVEKVTEGVRYTSPMWFASDPMREDPLARIVF